VQAATGHNLSRSEGAVRPLGL